jgi:hypothetical protein
LVEWQHRVLRAHEKVCVDFNVLLPLSRYRRFFKDSCNWAGGLTRTAVDAFIRIDVELLVFVEPIFSGSWVDAVDGTDIHARSIFGANTRLGDYIGHSEKILSKLSVREE